MAELKSVDDTGKINGVGKSWDDIVKAQIDNLADKYTDNTEVNKVLAKWHKDITLGVKHNQNFSPHVNGFYMVWMVHGTWYDKYLKYARSPGGILNPSPISQLPYKAAVGDHGGKLDPSTQGNSFNMLATDIDVPDITEEYISVSSRLRNSFVPSRNYFVSDFSISYIENINLEVIRYHEAWHKYLELLKRGEVEMYDSRDECEASNRDIFLDMPFTNAVWVAVFRPFTTDIQLLIKLVGVMPVTMPLKQVVGNRSASKMTVLNLQYKAADMFYKFYNGTEDMLQDSDGLLQQSFNREIIKPLTGK